MGTVHSFPELTGEERRRLRLYQAEHRRLRFRIDQRARELAARDQERYFRAILWDVFRGDLDASLIPFWEPVAGGVGVPERKGA
jgi:hypothetical protein